MTKKFLSLIGFALLTIAGQAQQIPLISTNNGSFYFNPTNSQLQWINGDTNTSSFDIAFASTNSALGNTTNITGAISSTNLAGVNSTNLPVLNLISNGTAPGSYVFAVREYSALNGLNSDWITLSVRVGYKPNPPSGLKIVILP